MPISYQFTDRHTGESRNLSDVDQEIVWMCEGFAVKAAEDVYHPFFDTFVTAAIGRLMKFGGCDLEPHMWAYLADFMPTLIKPSGGDGAAIYKDGLDVCVRACVLYLQSRYHFTAWR